MNFYAYAITGDLIGSVDANEGLTQYTYVNGPPHLLEDIIDPRGVRVSRNEYDTDGRLIATIDADGHRIELDHDIEGRTETITDRNGNVTVYVYSDRGDVLAESLQVCGITDGDPNNTDPANCRTETTTRTYNAFGYQLTETNPLGETMSWTYDTIGNVLSETNDLGETTEYSYDNGDRLLTLTDPSGTLAIDNAYDGRGNLLSVRDALGHETAFDYSPFTGLLETLSDAEGQVTAFEYDVNGFKTADIDACGTRIEFVVDELALLSRCQPTFAIIHRSPFGSPIRP